MRPAAYRFVMLGLGLVAQTSSSLFLYGMPMLLPVLRRSYGLSLGTAGWIVAAPTIGLLCTLLAWGVVVDRHGERWAMAVGLGVAGGLLLAAAAANSAVILALLLGVAGAAAGSVSAASGRMVLGWFPSEQRGLAMGARQTAQPLAVGLSALVLPPVAATTGVPGALVVCACFCLITAVLVGLLVVDPLRVGHGVATSATRSPYRTPTLYRLHAASSLLVIPQFAVSAFTLTYLVSERHWSTTGAGRLVFAFQLLGAAGRLAAGYWSDRVGSRLGPLRAVALMSAGSMAAVAVSAAATSSVVVAALGVAAVVTVADNGLGFTAVAEIAGTRWAGRALGAQSTTQNLAAALTPPLLGGLIGTAGFPVSFAVAALLPVLGAAVLPVRAEATSQ